MSTWDEPQPASSSLDVLAQAFSDQLVACLEECVRGRQGLFGASVQLEAGDEGWPEAARLRELAMALQGVYAQNEERCALAEEFLDLCSMHGEYNPGERRLARSFLERIAGGKVGTPTQEEHSW
ncbi:hypothetical protein ACOBR2_02970 [Telmatobacter bradus]|uniref:hypothetical protein n=1 Tax=Telmatobacter bradus TaxID=474953 RepID=UPI003B42FF53